MQAYRININDYLLTWKSGDIEGVATLQRSDRRDEGWVDAGVVTDLTSVTDTPTWVWSDASVTPVPPDIRSIRHRTWYYRIVHEGGILGPVHVDGSPDIVAFEVARLAARHLQRDVKTEAYLIHKPTYGERCATCWDDTRGQRKRTQCSDCDGSGYERGWGAATPLFVSISPQKEQPEQLNTMRFNQLQVPMWTGSLPLVSVGDFLLRKYDLSLFEIVRWQPTVRRNFFIRQTLMGRLVELNDPLYAQISSILST